MLLHVSVFLHHLQSALILCLLKLYSIKIIKLALNSRSLYDKMCAINEMW
jgi:hypothetical protein